MIIERIENGGKYRFLCSKEGKRTSILALECLNSKPQEVVSRLARSKITIAEREIAERKILRISPHFYNDEQEVGKLVEAL